MNEIDRQAIRQKRNAGELKQPKAKPAQTLGERLELELAEIDAQRNSPTFQDTGREKGLLDWADSVSGAPARAGIDEMVDPSVAPRDAFDYGPTMMAVINRIRGAMGKDPQTQPTGFDVAEKVTDSPYLGTALATGVDLANLPMGVPAEIKGVKYKGKVADATELFQQRGKTPPSPETKLAQWRGEAEVKDAMPRLIDEAEETYGAAQRKNADMSELKTIRKSAYDNPDLAPQTKPPKLTHPLMPQDLERFTQRLQELKDAYPYGAPDRKIIKEMRDLEDVLEQNAQIIEEQVRAQALRDNPPPKPKSDLELAEEKLSQFDFENKTPGILTVEMPSAQRRAIMEKLGVEGGDRAFKDAVQKGLIRPNVTSNEKLRTGGGDFLAQKEWRKQQPIPDETTFFDIDNDHSYTDEAKAALNSIASRYSAEHRILEKLKAAESGPDHLPYVGQAITAHPQMPLPNFNAKPTGTIGEPRIQGMSSISADPFSWMDDKYGAAKQLLMRHNSLGMPATINTSSDLIAKQGYIEKIPEGSTVNLYMLGPDDTINRLLYPGNPSLKRQEAAAEALERAGIDVNKIYPTVEQYIQNAADAYGNTPEKILSITGYGDIESFAAKLRDLGLISEAEKAAGVASIQSRLSKSGKYERISDDGVVVAPKKEIWPGKERDEFFQAKRQKEEAIRQDDWARKREMQARGATERAKAIKDEIDYQRQAHEEYETGDGAADYAYYMWEGKSSLKDLGNVGPETQELIDWAKGRGLSDEQIIQALKKHSEVETHGIRIPSDEYLEAFPLGEREIQIDGLAEKLKGLTPDELEYLKWEQGIKPDSDYIYHSMDDTVHYLIPDLEAAKKTLSRMKKTPPQDPMKQAIRTKREKKERK